MAEVPKEIFQEKSCQKCGHCSRIMKRCTQCHGALYCSRECQVMDWPSHKHVCLQPLLANDHHHTDQQTHQSRDSKFIFSDDVNNNLEADKDADSSKITVEKPYYMFNNELRYDLPHTESDCDSCKITVKANKEKYLIQIQSSWAGDDIFKVVACKVKIPLENLKVIHKGKMVDKDNILGVVRPRAVFQVIGEQAANEEGLDKCDINVMMLQLGIDRNTAVISLQKTGNLVDAIFEAGNK